MTINILFQSWVNQRKLFVLSKHTLPTKNAGYLDYIALYNTQQIGRTSDRWKNIDSNKIFKRIIPLKASVKYVFATPPHVCIVNVLDSSITCQGPSQTTSILVARRNQLQYILFHCRKFHSILPRCCGRGIETNLKS